MKFKSSGAAALAVVATIALAGSALAADTMLDPFTQTELETNWVADRQFPSGGVESVSAHGRDNVAAIGVVGADRCASSFCFFEGIKKVSDFGLAVQIDLYVPAEWENAATSPANVGFWSSDDPLTAYPLIVFRNGATVDAGFYGYDTAGAYFASGVEVKYGDWNTLSITLDPANDAVAYAINGQDAGGSYAGGESIGQVFLNHFNDGVSDYTAHWHAGLEEIDSKDQCKDGSWEAAGFKNQGQCIKFVNTGVDSR